MLMAPRRRQLSLWWLPLFLLLCLPVQARPERQAQVDQNNPHARNGVAERHHHLLKSARRDEQSASGLALSDKYRERADPAGCVNALVGNTVPCRKTDGTTNVIFGGGGVPESVKKLENQFSLDIYVGGTPTSQSSSHITTLLLTKLWNETLDNYDFHIHPEYTKHIPGDIQNSLHEQVESVHDAFIDKGGWEYGAEKYGNFEDEGLTIDDSEIDGIPQDEEENPFVGTRGPPSSTELLDELGSETKASVGPTEPVDEGREEIKRTEPLNETKRTVGPTGDENDGGRAETTVGPTKPIGEERKDITTIGPSQEMDGRDDDDAARISNQAGASVSFQISEVKNAEEIDGIDDARNGDESSSSAIPVIPVDGAPPFDRRRSFRLFHVSTVSWLLKCNEGIPENMAVRHLAVTFAAYHGNDGSPVKVLQLPQVSFYMEIFVAMMRREIESAMVETMNEPFFFAAELENTPIQLQMVDLVDESDESDGDPNEKASPTPQPAHSPTVSVVHDYSTPLQMDYWDWERYLGLALVSGTLTISIFLALWSACRAHMRRKTRWVNLAHEDGVSELLEMGWILKDGELIVYDKSKLGYSDDSSVFAGGYHQRETPIGAEITLPESETTPDSPTAGS